MRTLDKFLEKKFGKEKMERWTPKILIGSFAVLAVLTPINGVMYMDISTIESANERRKKEVVMPYIKEMHPEVGSKYVTLIAGEETRLCPEYSERNGFVLETQEPIRAEVYFPPDSMGKFFYKSSENREFSYDFCLTGKTNFTASERLYFDNLKIFLRRYEAKHLENKRKE